ncbi:MAG TPA: hypothetical protein VKM00_05660, partial [Luteimonas sp.]|nr:hypothetical protein [Luteimonas sp.]
ISGNRVSGVLGDAGSGDYGIYNFNDSRLAIRDNDLLGNTTAGSVGIFCTTGNASAKNNLVSGFFWAWKVCNDGGGNTVVP